MRSEAVPAGGNACRGTGAASKQAQDIRGQAAGHGGPEHKQEDVGEKRPLEAPGNEEQEEEKQDNWGEVSPAREESRKLAGGAAGMGADPGDHGVIEEEGGGAEEGGNKKG
jgi:hypothetical protein